MNNCYIIEVAIKTNEETLQIVGNAFIRVKK